MSQPFTLAALIAAGVRAVAVGLGATTAAYFDLARGRIPNALAVVLAVAGIATAAVADGLVGLTDSLAGAAVGGGLLLLCHLAGWLGAGDVKLMAAMGTLLGLVGTVWALFYTAVVGGAVGVGVLIWKGKLLWGLKRAFSLRALMHPGEVEERITIPYGFAIAVGTLMAVFLRGALGGALGMPQW